MCFYDMYVMSCTCSKWGHFRQHCAKEYRTGETCGMKLIMNTIPDSGTCKLCQKIETKKRSIGKESEKIWRWQREGHRSASIDKSRGEIAHLEAEIRNLEYERDSKRQALR